MMGAKLRPDRRKITQLEAATLLDMSNTTWNKYETDPDAKIPRHIRLAMSALLHGLPPYGPVARRVKPAA
jgi:transcriptional regulator with XRE-family HTH domain